MTKMHERQNDDICVNQRSRIEIVHKKKIRTQSNDQAQHTRTCR